VTSTSSLCLPASSSTTGGSGLLAAAIALTLPGPPG
jgi:hypothetical protein